MTKSPVAVSTIASAPLVISPVLVSVSTIAKAIEPISTVVFGETVAVSTLATTAPLLASVEVPKTEPDWKRKMREKAAAEAARKAAEEAVKKASIAYLYKK